MHPVSSRLISTRLGAAPFSITIVQVYEPTADCHDDQLELFCIQLKEVIDKVDTKDIMQGDWNAMVDTDALKDWNAKVDTDALKDWNAKVDTDALKDWKNYCGPSYNAASNELGLCLLEFTSYNDAMLANTLHEHEVYLRWTWAAPNVTRHQIDYIMVQNRFRYWIHIAKTWIFPGPAWQKKMSKESEEHDNLIRSIQKNQQEDNERHESGKKD